MYISNGVWDIVDFYSSVESVKFSCCLESFSEIRYTFKLKRLPQFFLMYLIWPCLAIVGLALLSFVIPPDTGERIGFGVTVILSFSVYLIFISDKLPEKSDKVPLLGTLFVSVLYILVASFILSTINVRLASNTHPPPKWLLKMMAQKWELTPCKKRRICEQKSRKDATDEVQEMDEKHEEMSTGFKVRADGCADCNANDHGE